MNEPSSPLRAAAIEVAARAIEAAKLQIIDRTGSPARTAWTWSQPPATASLPPSRCGPSRTAPSAPGSLRSTRTASGAVEAAKAGCRALKGARDSSEGRLVPLMMTSAQALADYLRARRSHKMAKLPALWLGTRNRGPMTGSGVYQMLDRRAEEAGYDPQAVHPHISATLSRMTG